MEANKNKNVAFLSIVSDIFMVAIRREGNKEEKARNQASFENTF